MNKLQELLDEVRSCRICLETPQKTPLPHTPRPVLQASPTAKLLIAGQAPGARVHATGLPFNDPSGDRLRYWLGVSRELFYDPLRIAVVPMGFCFPGYDRRGYAQLWHMTQFCRPTLTETLRSWREPFENLTPRVLPLPHPSWRNSGWLKGTRGLKSRSFPFSGAKWPASRLERRAQAQTLDLAAVVQPHPP